MELVYENPTPQHCDIGNLVYNKEYDKAIELGEMLLTDATASELPMLYINLMAAYVKKKNTEKTIEYAIKAIKAGHATLLSFDRLTIELKKVKRYYALLNVCHLVLDCGYKTSYYGSSNMSGISNRKCFAKKHLKDSIDTPDDIIFSEKEIQYLAENSIKQYEEQEREANKPFPTFEEWKAMRNK